MLLNCLVAVNVRDGVLLGTIVFVDMRVAVEVCVAVGVFVTTVTWISVGVAVGLSAAAVAVSERACNSPATPVARQITPETSVKESDHTNNRQPRCPALRRRRQ